MFEIAEELKKLPDQPGVYIMHDSRDAIIYIGKAVSLRKRVHQYFQASHDEGIKKVLPFLEKFSNLASGTSSPHITARS